MAAPPPLQCPLAGSLDGLTNVRSRIAESPESFRIVKMSCLTPLELREQYPCASIYRAQLTSAPS